MFQKFQILAEPLEYWYLEDIKRIMYGCTLMHNYMVEFRQSRDEEEREDTYILSDGLHKLNETPNIVPLQRVPDRAIGAAETLQTYVDRAIGINPSPEHLLGHLELQKQRWLEL